MTMQPYRVTISEQRSKDATTKALRRFLKSQGCTSARKRREAIRRAAISKARP